MRGQLHRCWILVYRAPLAEVAAELPPELEPVRFGGFGFWNVVVCEVEKMRPKGFPKPLGLNCRQVAYRIHTRRQNPDGTSFEGLYFLRSDCDSRLISSAGNALTEFKFHLSDIGIHENPVATMLSVDAPGASGHATIYYGRPVHLADGSPFESLQEAAEFLKYRPYGLSVNPARGVEVFSVRRDESKWKAAVVTANSDHWDFLDGKHAKLEIAYEVSPIDYEWLPARASSSQGPETKSDSL